MHTHTHTHTHEYRQRGRLIDLPTDMLTDQNAIQTRKTTPTKKQRERGREQRESEMPNSPEHKHCIFPKVGQKKERLPKTERVAVCRLK